MFAWKIEIAGYVVTLKAKRVARGFSWVDIVDLI